MAMDAAALQDVIAILDGTHRAVALYTARERSATAMLHVPAFVLRRQLR